MAGTAPNSAATQIPLWGASPSRDRFRKTRVTVATNAAEKAAFLEMLSLISSSLRAVFPYYLRRMAKYIGLCCNQIGSRNNISGLWGLKGAMGAIYG